MKAQAAADISTAITPLRRSAYFAAILQADKRRAVPAPTPPPALNPVHTWYRSVSNPPTVCGSSLDRAARRANRRRLGLCQTGVFCLRIYLRLSTPLPAFLSAPAFLAIPAFAPGAPNPRSRQRHKVRAFLPFASVWKGRKLKRVVPGTRALAALRHR